MTMRSNNCHLGTNLRDSRCAQHVAVDAIRGCRLNDIVYTIGIFDLLPSPDRLVVLARVCYNNGEQKTTVFRALDSYFCVVRLSLACPIPRHVGNMT